MACNIFFTLFYMYIAIALFVFRMPVELGLAFNPLATLTTMSKV